MTIHAFFLDSHVLKTKEGVIFDPDSYFIQKNIVLLGKNAKTEIKCAFPYTIDMIYKEKEKSPLYIAYMIHN